MFKQGKKHRDIFSLCVRHDDEEIVQSGLAVTPSQMLEMTEKGIPISPANLGLEYQDGVSKLDFEPMIDYRRGVDIGDIWEADKAINAKFKTGFGKKVAEMQDVSSATN